MLFRSARSADGTAVPMTVVRAASVGPGAGAPCLVVVYGAYGHCLPTDFQPEQLALLQVGTLFFYFPSASLVKAGFATSPINPAQHACPCHVGLVLLSASDQVRIFCQGTEIWQVFGSRSVYYSAPVVTGSQCPAQRVANCCAAWVGGGLCAREGRRGAGPPVACSGTCGQEGSEC